MYILCCYDTPPAVNKSPRGIYRYYVHDRIVKFARFQNVKNKAPSKRLLLCRVLPRPTTFGMNPQCLEVSKDSNKELAV